MKILIIGVTGTIGSAVAAALGSRHEVIGASRRGSLAVDLGDPRSIESLLAEVGELDAIVSTAGVAKFGKLDELSDEDFALGLGNKLMGQVNLIRLGRRHLRDRGSITLTSGILARMPNPMSSMLTMINAGLEGFVRAAALDLPRRLRANVVSPPLVAETVVKMGWGTGGLPAARVAEAYVQAVEGEMSGAVIEP